MTLAKRMVEAGAREYFKALGKSEQCTKCVGEGYHHGHDPDWCEECDGSGYVWPTSELDASRAALIAALKVWHNAQVPGKDWVHLAQVITELEQDK